MATKARSKADHDDASKKRRARPEEDKPKKRVIHRKGPGEPAPEEAPPVVVEAAPEVVEEPVETPEREEERPEELLGEDGEPRVRPIMTPMGVHAVRDDDLNEAQVTGEQVITTPEAPPEGERNPDAPGEHQLQVLKLNDLKRMKITELSKMAQNLGIEGTQGLKKQELLKEILSNVADKRYEVQAEGVMEMLSDGYGFLRSADSDYQPSPDDIYVSPSQVRRFNLRPGDTVTGPIRQPREGERYFALQKVEKINFAEPFSRRRQGAHPLRQPHRALPDQEAAARARPGRLHHPHHRPVLPHRPGPALPHRRPAQGRQDGDAAEHRPRHRQEPPGHLPHRAAGR